MFDSLAELRVGFLQDLRFRSYRPSAVAETKLAQPSSDGFPEGLLDQEAIGSNKLPRRQSIASSYILSVAY
jgi:hypothetical protein